MPDHNAFLKTASIRFVPRDANRASHFGFALINDQCALLWNLEGAQRVLLRVEIDIEDDQILVFGLRRERRHDRLLRPAFCAPRRGDMHQNGFARFERGLKRLGLVGEAIRGQGVDGGQQQDCRGEERRRGFIRRAPCGLMVIATANAPAPARNVRTVRSQLRALPGAP
jgi:hypothetical protein